jgi:arsenate reductase
MDKKPKILFLSRGNVTACEMAEGYLRKFFGEKFAVAIASTKPGTVPAQALEVMAEDGVDISGQRPKNAAESLKEHFSFVVTVSDWSKERHPIFPFTRNLFHWNVSDPSLGNVPLVDAKQALRKVRDDIKAKVQTLVEVVDKQTSAWNRAA